MENGLITTDSQLNDVISNIAEVFKIEYEWELIEKRRIARENKEWKLSDEIRKQLDEKLVFVFDMKDKDGKQYQEVRYLNDDYFNHIYEYKEKYKEGEEWKVKEWSETQMEKIERNHNIKFKSKREYVEWNIKQDIQSEKRIEAWIYSMQNSK